MRENSLETDETGQIDLTLNTILELYQDPVPSQVSSFDDIDHHGFTQAGDSLASGLTATPVASGLLELGDSKSGPAACSPGRDGAP